MTQQPSAASPAIDTGGSLELHYATFEASFEVAIRADHDGRPRPVGDAEDIGAFERP